MTMLDWHAERSDLKGMALLDREPNGMTIDMKAVRLYRLARVREEMKKRDIGALILSCPVNIRYATGARNMQVFCARNTPSRYLLITEKRTVLYEFTGCEHLPAGLETVDEVRPAMTASFVAAGRDIAQREKAWAKAMLDVITDLAGRNVTVGMERMNAGAALALADLGVRLVDAQEPVEMARCIKSPEEIKCVEASLRATERAVYKLRDSIRPGITENELWSVLHQSVIAEDGDYIETRLLSAGERTNPWFQESSGKVIGVNELVCLDTDTVGCYGYYSDFSRTFHVGPDKPREEQKTLYKVALEQVYHNISILKPGLTFKEYSEQAWDIPEKYIDNRYYLSSHGVGMTGEYPYLYHRKDYPAAGYQGVVEPGMTICVEAYIGENGGHEGVKLEQQCLITETGVEILSEFPFEENLMDDFHVPGFRVPTIAPNDPAAASAIGSVGSQPDVSRVVEMVAEEMARSANAAQPARHEPWPQLGAPVFVPAAIADKVDMTLFGADVTPDLVAGNCSAAIDAGLGSLSVPPSLVKQAVQEMRRGRTPIRTTVGLPGMGVTPETKAFEIRQAIRNGARAIDIVIDVVGLRNGAHDQVVTDLSKVMESARESRTRTTVVLESWMLGEEQLVMAARMAARVRADVIATSLGTEGRSSSSREIELIREAAGNRPQIRATIAPDCRDADRLLQAGADRLGLFGSLAKS